MTPNGTSAGDGDESDATENWKGDFELALTQGRGA
jgi:hypothetical protein